jgi:hypothetical protein
VEVIQDHDGVQEVDLRAVLHGEFDGLMLMEFMYVTNL